MHERFIPIRILALLLKGWRIEHKANRFSIERRQDNDHEVSNGVMKECMIFQVRVVLTVLLLFPLVVFAQTGDGIQVDSQQSEEIILPKWGIKTNLLYDATATINLGVEIRTGERMSLDISGNYNNWTFKNDRKWKHYLVQPELRWWLRETFDGHFFGLHGHYAIYNVGSLPKPPFSEYMNTHRFEGWLAGAGVSYGYRWNFDPRWALEATVGVGYAYLSYDKFNCGRCGELLASAQTKNWFGPTKAGVSLIYGIGGGKAAPALPVYIAPPPPPPVVVVPPPVYQPVLRTGFIVPEAEAVKARSESGSAYLDFVVARSEIITGFRNNASELQKIYSTIEQVRNNPDVTITGLSIVGHASPEGSYASNMALSERRAQALKNHICSIFDLNEGFFSAWSEGEDWARLDSLVAASSMFEKYNALEIIRGKDDYDVRENRLKALADGSVYRQILAEYYPQLRRSDYRISYTVAPFTVEKGKEVFRTRPGDLSLNEMFLIAETYEPGSDAFNEVFETAARIFPDSDVANLNAAASALGRRDTAAAASYLDRMKERGAAYWNNQGILAWQQGDKQKAAECFVQGGDPGVANAAELEKHMNSLR